MKYFEVIVDLPNHVEIFLGTVKAVDKSDAMEQGKLLYSEELSEYSDGTMTVEEA